MMESQPLQDPTAEAQGAEPAGAQPAVVPGKEFTRTCKGLVVVLVGGYVLLQLLPSSLNYLAIVPAKTIPFVWTVFTAGYIEQVLPGAIGSSLGLLFCGKDIEPVWGRKEFLKFIILVNSVCGVLAFCFAVALYYVTGKESFLVTPLSGFHGCLAGFLVGLKQLLPNLELPMCFFWKIKAKWMPFFVLCFSTIMAFIVPDSINFLPTLLSGMYVSWIYLRYFQRNPLTGLKGDPSDDFSFPSLFPDAMRPVTDPVANLFDRMLCSRSRPSELALPVSDPTKASRRRRRRHGEDGTKSMTIRRSRTTRKTSQSYSEQSRRALPKNLIRPLPVQDFEGDGSGDLLSRTTVHAGGRDGVNYVGRRSTMDGGGKTLD